MILNKQQVMEVIPHRPPILLVDEVLSWQFGKNLHARRKFEVGDSIFEGHFLDNPVVPGVLIVEGMAQSAALLTNLTLERNHEQTIFYFVGIEDARFKAPVVPDQTVDFYVTQKQTRRGMYWFEGEAKVDNKQIAKANFVAKLVDK